MKKIILFTIIVTVLNCTIIAQNQNDSTEQKIGTNNSGQGNLWKKVQGSDDIYKNPEDGNVGIGTQDPQTTLEVKGEFSTDSMNVNGTLTAIISLEQEVIIKTYNLHF